MPCYSIVSFDILFGNAGHSSSSHFEGIACGGKILEHFEHSDTTGTNRTYLLELLIPLRDGVVFLFGAAINTIDDPTIPSVINDSARCDTCLVLSHKWDTDTFPAPTGMPDTVAVSRSTTMDSLLFSN